MSRASEQELGEPFNAQTQEDATLRESEATQKTPPSVPFYDKVDMQQVLDWMSQSLPQPGKKPNLDQLLEEPHTVEKLVAFSLLAVRPLCGIFQLYEGNRKANGVIKNPNVALTIPLPIELFEQIERYRTIFMSHYLLK